MAGYCSSQKQTAAQILFFRDEPETADPLQLRVAAGCELAESAFVGGELPKEHVGKFIESFVMNKLEDAEQLVASAGGRGSPQSRHLFNHVLTQTAPDTLGIGRCGFSENSARRPVRAAPAAVVATGFWDAVPIFVAHRARVRGDVPVGCGLP